MRSSRRALRSATPNDIFFPDLSSMPLIEKDRAISGDRILAEDGFRVGFDRFFKAFRAR
jgi:hypothetical protein